MGRDRKLAKRLKKQERIGDIISGEVQRLWKQKFTDEELEYIERMMNKELSYIISECSTAWTYEKKKCESILKKVRKM